MARSRLSQLDTLQTVHKSFYKEDPSLLYMPLLTFGGQVLNPKANHAFGHLLGFPKCSELEQVKEGRKGAPQGFPVPKQSHRLCRLTKTH